MEQTNSIMLASKAVSIEISAIQSRKAIECTPIELDKVLMASVRKALNDVGTNVKDKQEKIDHIVENLCGEVLKQVPYIRIEEIPLAIDNGVYGVYGQYMGINTASIVMFLKSYYESRKRADIAKSMKVVEEKKEPSPEELRAQENEIIINAFDKWKLSGRYEDYGNHIYNKLDERKLIPFTASRKKEFMEEAKEQLLKKNSPKLAQTKEEKRTLDQVTCKILSKTDESKNMLVREAKQIALLKYFEELDNLEIHIRDEIHETE